MRYQSQREWEKNLRFGFIVTMIYLVVEYGRPQDTIPGLSLLHPGMIMVLFILFAWVKSGGIFSYKNKQTKYMFLFLLLLAIYIPFARNVTLALAYARGFMMYLPVFLSIILYVDSFQRLRRLIDIWVLLMVYICVNIVIHGPGAGGGNFLVDENDYSLLLNMMLPFAFFLFLQEEDKKKKIYYLLACGLAITSIVISFSRGGFVGLICVGSIMWLYSPRKALSLIVIVLAASFVYLYGGEKYLSEMSTITNTEQSTASERIETWKSGLNMFLDRPYGVGGGNFRVWFQEYQTEKLRVPMWGRAAHSLWIQLITEVGVAGIIIYGLLAIRNIKDILWLKRLKDSDDKEKIFAYYLSISFIAAFAGYFSSGTFISVLYYPHYFYITAFIVATKKLVEVKLQEEATIEKEAAVNTQGIQAK